MRKICVITGTRAEYGILKPVIKLLSESKKSKLQIIATGMHLLPEFGLTIEEIKKDGYKIDARIPSIVSGNDKSSMAISIGLGIIGLTEALDVLNPDIVVILGDRFEILAAAIAASYSGRILAHLAGGDNPHSGYDEYTRHAISKIAHIHFAFTKKSRERIIKLGENPNYVFFTGSSALDTILNMNFPSEQEIRKKFNIVSNLPIVLILQHPLSTEPEKAALEMKITLEAVMEFQVQIVLIYPNVDPGGIEIINTIKEYEKRYDNILTFKNLPFEDYLSLMKISAVMIGNSSSGIIESPSLRLPVINIGSRQEGREKADNILNVKYDKNQIKKAIDKALNDADFKKKVANCINPYGDGKSAERIVKILEEIKIDDNLIKKKLTY
ncbi:MAG: UDP-N-acetylglucosamine 2-epimerase [Candidatus Helarchaeota archaeon]